MHSNSDNSRVPPIRHKRALLWLLALCATVGSLILYLQRWADESLKALPTALGEVELGSILGGFLAVAVVRTSWDLIRTRCYLRALLPPLCTAAIIASFPHVLVFQRLLSINYTWLVVGSVIGFVCFFSHSRPMAPPSPIKRPVAAFSVYFLATCNYLLLATPFSSHLPSLMEDGENFSWANFYLGSIHADISPIYVLARGFINMFSADPVINATALVSLTLVAIGLGFSALIIHRMAGALWAWGFLFLSWTDRWVIVSSVASSLIPQPIMVGGLGLAFCGWALYRRPEKLRASEAWLVGCIVAAGTLLSLYSYSGVRFNWICSSALMGLILVARKILPASKAGVALLFQMAVPPMLLVLALWLVVFGGDTRSFADQVFTSRSAWVFIESPEVTPAPVKPFNDVDVPIWWGSGIDERNNHVVYWKRTPWELFDRVVRYFWQWSATVNIEPYLVVTGFVALLLGLLSPWRERVVASALVGAFAVHSYLPILIAQAPEAFRRGTFSAVSLLLLITLLFSSAPRTKICQICSLVALTLFAFVKAPLELNAVLRTHMSTSLATGVCLACTQTGDLPLKLLVSSPLFSEIRDRQLLFLLNFGLPPFQQGCMYRALRTREFKQFAPNAQAFSGASEDLDQTVKSLQSKQILVLTCHQGYTGNKQIISACGGTAPEGSGVLGEVPSRTPGRGAWWIALEKL